MEFNLNQTFNFKLFQGLNLTCKENLYGNTIHIAKNGGTRIDILALCEVNIYGEVYRRGSE